MILALLLLAAMDPLRVQIVKNGSFTLDSAELTNPMTINMNGVVQPVTPGPAIRLTFHGSSNRAFPKVILGDPRTGPDGYFGVNGFFSMPNRDLKTSSAWIPIDYPSSMKTLKVTIHDLIDKKAADCIWVISGIPTKKMEMPPIRESAPFGKRTISAMASLNRSGEGITPELSLSSPIIPDSWYWECRSYSPFTSVEPGMPDSRFTEWPYQAYSPTYAVSMNYRYCSLIDRILMDGSLSHFQSDSQEVVIPDIRPVDSSNGDVGIKEDVKFRTPDGIQGTVTNNRSGWAYNGPGYRKAARLVVTLDQATLDAGIEEMLRRFGKTTPDRIDVYIEAVGVQNRNARSGESARQGIDTANGYRPQLDRGFGILLVDDQITPSITLHVRIVRRVADQEFPFHLVVPVSKNSQFP